MSHKKPQEEEQEAEVPDEKLKRFMSWVVVILISVFAIVAGGSAVYHGYTKGIWLDIAKQHFAAVVGLPLAAVAALFVVLVLRMAAGPINVEIGILRFKGAAAPIVFWLLCFFTIATAIKMLW